MAGFRKAKAEQAALKVGMYGPPGSGKTFTSLLFCEGLAKITNKRTAYVDTERGTDFYCQSVASRKAHPEAFDFDALYTRSITEVSDALHSLDRNVYGQLVLDSISHIWEAAINAYGGKTTSIGTIPMQAWGQIKRPYKKIINWLLNTDIHWFIVGRQGNVWEKNEATGEIEMVGFKMKAEGETPFEPHILLRMESDRRKDGDSVIQLFAEKDRTGLLQGKTIEWPTFDKVIKPILPLLGTTQAQTADADDTASKDAEALAKQDDEKETKSAETLKKFKAKIDLAGTPDELKAVGKSITPEVKKGMNTSDVTTLREYFLEAERNVAVKAAVQS